MKALRTKVFHNKKNNQLMVALPRRAIPFLKDKHTPRFLNLRLREDDMEY